MENLRCMQCSQWMRRSLIPCECDWGEVIYSVGYSCDRCDCEQMDSEQMNSLRWKHKYNEEAKDKQS